MLTTSSTRTTIATIAPMPSTDFVILSTMVTLIAHHLTWTMKSEKRKLHLKQFLNSDIRMHVFQLVPTLMTLELQSIISVRSLLKIQNPTIINFEEADLSEIAKEFYNDNRRVSNNKIKEKLGIALKFPTFREVADEFCEFVKDSTLIIHNSKSYFFTIICNSSIKFVLNTNKYSPTRNKRKILN